MKHGIVDDAKIGDEGEIKLTVQSGRAGVLWRNVAVMHDHPGDAQSIEEGDHVVIDQCDDGLFVCLGVLNTDPDIRPGSLSGKEKVMRFDDGTEISASPNDTGGYDVTISASGDVTIGSADNAVSVAVQEHSHSYSWTDSGGSGSTGTPNEQGTETAVE